MGTGVKEHPVGDIMDVIAVPLDKPAGASSLGNHSPVQATRPAPRPLAELTTGSPAETAWARTTMTDRARWRRSWAARGAGPRAVALIVSLAWRRA